MLVIEAIGNLGSDAVVKSINQKDYVSFDLAHSEGSGDSKEIVWVSVLWYGQGGNLRQYLTKGAKVFVRGRMRARIYTAKDGTSNVSVSCFASEVFLCGGRSESGAGQPSHDYQQRPQYQQPSPALQQGAVSLEDDNDLPDFRL
jgi:hypothetical protein